MTFKIFAVTALASLGLSSAAMAQSTNCYSNPSGLAQLVEGAMGAAGFTCAAPTVGAATGSRWDTRAFVGLAFSFGTGDYSPKGGVHLTAGVRRTNIAADNNVYGAELHGSINLLEWKDIQIRGLGLFGNRNVLGNAGVGFDVFKLTPLAVAGVQIPYARAFVDLYAFSWDVRGFAEANTYGRIQPIRPSAPSCTSPASLENEQQASQQFKNYAPGFPLNGGILTGSLGAAPINGQPSAAWVNGVTCFGQTAQPIVEN